MRPGLLAGIRRGSAQGLPLVVNATGRSGFSATNYVSSSSSAELAATAAMTIIVYFRVDALLGVERIFSKGSASSNGWSVYFIDQELFFRFWGNTVAMDITTAEADAVGKTFCAVGTIDASGARLYLGSLSENLNPALRGFNRGAPVSAIDDTVTAFAVGPFPAAIGAQRGDSPLQPAPNVTMIGCGIGNQRVTESEAAEMMRDATALGYVPTDFPGATNVYNAVTGLGTDQVGSTNLTINGTLTAETDFTPDLPGLVHAGILAIGQSNMVAPLTVADLSATYQATYTGTKQFHGSAWVDLAPRGDNATGPWVIFGRLLDTPTIRGDADDTRLVTRSSSGTDLATDWDPTGGLYLAALGSWEDGQDDLADPLDFMELRTVVWLQGEADALDATDAGNYQANEAAMFDAILADYAGAIPETLFVVGQLPAFQTMAHKATVIAAKASNASARSDVALINTDDLVSNGDNLHYDEPSAESLGETVPTVVTTRANATAPAP